MNSKITSERLQRNTFSYKATRRLLPLLDNLKLGKQCEIRKKLHFSVTLYMYYLSSRSFLLWKTKILNASLNYVLPKVQTALITPQAHPITSWYLFPHVGKTPSKRQNNSSHVDVRTDFFGALYCAGNHLGSKKFFLRIYWLSGYFRDIPKAGYWYRYPLDELKWSVSSKKGNVRICGVRVVHIYTLAQIGTKETLKPKM